MNTPETQSGGSLEPVGSATALHIWYLRPSGEAVGLMLPQGTSLDAALHVKEALEEGALSITVLREWVKPNCDYTTGRPYIEACKFATQTLS